MRGVSSFSALLEFCNGLGHCIVLVTGDHATDSGRHCSVSNTLTVFNRRKLISMYDQKSGLFDDLWWQTPSALGALATLYSNDLDFRKEEDASGQMFRNTFEKASHFHNRSGYYDEHLAYQQWWALGFLDMYDVNRYAAIPNNADFIAANSFGYVAACGGLRGNKKQESTSALATGMV